MGAESAPLGVGVRPPTNKKEVRLMELKHKDFVNCSWCSTVKRRDTHEPIAEPLQTRLRKEIESHGMCEPCAVEVRRPYKCKKEQKLADALVEEIKNGP